MRKKMKFKSKFEKFSSNDLIRYTYKNYPFYAINSKIAGDFRFGSAGANYRGVRYCPSGRGGDGRLDGAVY